MKMRNISNLQYPDCGYSPRVSDTITDRLPLCAPVSFRSILNGQHPKFHPLLFPQICSRTHSPTHSVNSEPIIRGFLDQSAHSISWSTGGFAVGSISSPSECAQSERVCTSLLHYSALYTDVGETRIFYLSRSSDRPTICKSTLLQVQYSRKVPFNDHNTHTCWS